MTDAELFTRLGQLLDVIESLRQEMRDGFAAAAKRDEKLEADVAELKAESVNTNKRLAALENEMLGVKQAQVVMNARLEDQWRVVTALIPTRVAAVGLEPVKSAGKR